MKSSISFTFTILRQAELVKLRFFMGLTLDEAAEALAISTATADRHWAFAKAWLYQAFATTLQKS